MAVAAAAALLVAGCGSSGGDQSTTSAPGKTTTSSRDPLEGEVAVSAASSLTEAFGKEESAFEAAHPRVDVVTTFDASSTLVDQITSGASVDVFASADTANMDKVTSAGLNASPPVTIARNRLVIVTAPGNPKGIASLADLADAGVVALCGADVPCGKFAAQVLEHANVDIPESSVTRGQNAKATLASVTHGDAVAAIVYVTDAKAVGDQVDAVEIPEADNVVATLPITVLGKHANPAASAFVAFVASEPGQEILRDAGFLPPA
jgi:molybdate transport system substrate-binding protein